MQQSDGAAESDDGLYLRSEVKLELLAFRWYVWPHLIPPLQHAMNMAFRHIPVLQSFVSNPSIHLKAAADPALLGGPFVDLPVSELEKVLGLLDETRQQAGSLLELASQYKAFDRQLQEGSAGYSLDDFYQKLPVTLQGCAELAYDLNSHPHIRVMEPLLYGQQLNELAGREVGLSLIPDSQRKFFLTTPRIDNAAAVFMKMGFDDRRIDVLASMRTTPMRMDQLLKELKVDVRKSNLLEPFLTTEPPVRKTPRFSGKGVRVRHFGHACVLLETAHVSILLDPLFAWERDSTLATLTFHDLPDQIDFVVFSHSHMDHFCPEVIVQLRRRVGRFIVPRNQPGDVADPSMKLMLNALGCHSVSVVDHFDTVPVGDGQIESLPFPGEHCGLSIQSKHSIHITLGGHRFLFLVDSDAVDPRLYERLDSRLRELTAVFLGMECHGSPLTWFYGPLLTRPISRRNDESRRGNASNCERAWNAIQHVDSKNIYVYAMGNEPWNRHLLGLEYSSGSIQITESDEFVRRCRQAGQAAKRMNGCSEMYFE
jgi:L-ascorbate metabolism protein UlaG (beta-lactamase superfamily)